MKTCLNLFAAAFIMLTMLSATDELSPLDVNVIVILEGAFTGIGEMSTNLQDNDLIPNLPVGLNNSSVTDWIVLRLIDEDCNIVASGNTFLRKDGKVSMSFPDVEEGKYYIQVDHRNHLAVMSAEPVSLPNSSGSAYDFTSNIESAFGKEQLKEKDGVFCMIAGDCDGNNLINAVDYKGWFANNAGNNVYNAYDLDVNGIINVLDYNLWYSNRSRVGRTCN